MRTGPLRWRALFLAVVLLPGAAWGEQTAHEILKERRDHELWKDGGGCPGAERYLNAFPQGLHAGEAQECLDAEKEERGEKRRRMKGYEEGAYKALERGNVAGARRRLEELRKLDETAPEVMDLEDAIAEAEKKLGTMRKYAKTGREALGRGDLEKARKYVERLRGLDAKSSLAVELEEEVAEAERERKAKEAEEAARRAEAERQRKAKEAERRADDEAFARAKRLHTESGYRAYLARGGRHEAEARALLSKVTEPAWDVGEKFRDCPECPELVVVPSGRFRMGSPSGESGRADDEGPVHEVTISRPFAVGVHEVTRGEFARFVSATGHSMGNACWTHEGGEWKERSGRHWKSPGFSQTDSHPVVCVNWNDAKAYVRWLSGETGAEYRLLSESEWEYVARAGTTTARYWGEGESGQCRYANGADASTGFDWGTGCNDGHARTSPVGRFHANGYKLHDVLGNVWEWVEDCWNDSYNGAPADGSAWKSGKCRLRGLRSGSWAFLPLNLRSAKRNRDPPGLRFSNAGLRVARTLTP